MAYEGYWDEIGNIESENIPESVVLATWETGDVDVVRAWLDNGGAPSVVVHSHRGRELLRLRIRRLDGGLHISCAEQLLALCHHRAFASDGVGPSHGSALGTAGAVSDQERNSMEHASACANAAPTALIGRRSPGVS